VVSLVTEVFHVNSTGQARAVCHVDLSSLVRSSEHVVEVSSMGLVVKLRFGTVGLLDAIDRIVLSSLEEAETYGDSQNDCYKHGSCDGKKDDVDLSLVLLFGLSDGVLADSTDSGSGVIVRSDNSLLIFVPLESRSLLLLVVGHRHRGGTVRTGESSRLCSRAITLRNADVLTSSVSAEDGSTKEYVSRSQLSGEFLAQVLESLIGIWVVVLSHDEEVNDDGTLVDGNHFDCTGVDSEHRSDAIGKLHSSSIGVELIQGPGKTDFTHNGVLGPDLKFTSRSEVDLQNVNNSDEAVLSTPSLGQRLVTAKFRVPLRHLLKVSLQVDGVGTSVGVWNADHGTASVTVKLVAHLARRSTVVGDAVVFTTLDEGREARQTKLSGVEAIPDVVHHRVEDVSVPRGQTLDSHRLH